jgi:hypothetical protein
MPPEPVNCSEYGAPTAPVNRVPLGGVITGLAGTVRVTLLVVAVSATEVAVTVTVCVNVVAAGAVKVAEVVVVFERVPPPLTVQVTPPLFLSFATVAVSVTAFDPSTVVTDAVTTTDDENFELPPQPESERSATSVRRHTKNGARTLQPDRAKPLWNTDTSGKCWVICGGL